MVSNNVGGLSGGRDTTTASSPPGDSSHLVSHNGCNGQPPPRQHAALPHGQEVEGLSVAGPRGRSAGGGAERGLEHGAGEPRHAAAHVRVVGEEAAQA